MADGAILDFCTEHHRLSFLLSIFLRLATWPKKGQVFGVNTHTFLTLADQVAEHLRTEILRGRWSSTLPGKHRLADELGVNNKTVEAALRQLENNGLLLPQGAGRKRLINSRRYSASRALRIAMLLSERRDQSWDVIADIHHGLRQAGHAAFYADKTLADLAMKPARVAALVSRTPADAWLVVAGSQEVLEWFAARPQPVFAVFGRMLQTRIPGAAPRKIPALVKATRTLLDLGHRRIALLIRPRHLHPQPGLPVQAFLEELQACGIPPTSSPSARMEGDPSQLSRHAGGHVSRHPAHRADRGRGRILHRRRAVLPRPPTARARGHLSHLHG